MGRLIKNRSFYNKPWYGSYKSMMERCYNAKSGNYHRYGGRGIRVCEEWHDITKFEAWVDKSNYQKGLSIERKNVDGHYCPENCIWATSKQQCNNRTNTVYVEHKGEVHTISEWSEITGINRSTLNNRYYRGDRGDKLFRPTKTYTGKTWIIENGKRRWIECA